MEVYGTRFWNRVGLHQTFVFISKLKHKVQTRSLVTNNSVLNLIVPYDLKAGRS